MNTSLPLRNSATAFSYCGLRFWTPNVKHTQETALTLVGLARDFLLPPSKPSVSARSLAIKLLTIIGRGWAKYRDLSASANNWSARHWQIMIFCDNWVQSFLSFDYQDCFHILITSWQLREVICHFSLKNVVLIIHEQNIICSKTRLDSTTHEQTIICRQLFAGHVVGSWPMERRKKCIQWWRIFIVNNRWQPPACLRSWI